MNYDASFWVCWCCLGKYFWNRNDETEDQIRDSADSLIENEDPVVCVVFSGGAYETQNTRKNLSFLAPVADDPLRILLTVMQGVENRFWQKFHTSL